MEDPVVLIFPWTNFCFSNANLKIPEMKMDGQIFQAFIEVAKSVSVWSNGAR